MLRLLTGKTGSGKSYQAVSLIFDDLEKDKKVFTNIRLSIEDDNYYYLDELALKNFLVFINDTFENVENLDDKKEEIKQTKYFGGSFYIDEAHLVGFRNKTEAILNWLTLQRHFDQNITIITQVASNIHRDYLLMFHSHIDMIPQNKRLSVGSMGYREFDAYKGDRLKTQYFKPKLQIFELYSSGNKETGISADVKKLALILVGIIGLVVIFFFLLPKNFFTDPSTLNKNITENNSSSVNYISVPSVIPSSDPKNQNVSDYNKTSSFETESLICSTDEGCYYGSQKLSVVQFLTTVLSKKKSFSRSTVARSSSGWSMYKFKFTKD